MILNTHTPPSEERMIFETWPGKYWIHNFLFYNDSLCRTYNDAVQIYETLKINEFKITGADIEPGTLRKYCKNNTNHIKLIEILLKL